MHRWPVWWARQWLRAHPADLEKFGVGSAGSVRVRSARGELVVEAVADDTVPRAVASVDFNLESDGRAAAAALIDSRQPVVDIRMETP